MTTGRLTHCTISGNPTGGQATGALAIGAVHGGAGVIVENCIVAGNHLTIPAAEDIAGGVTLAGRNLLGSYGITPTGLIGIPSAPVSPNLLPADRNGGFSKTMRPAVGSVVLNAALATANTPLTDARGYPRIAGGAADLGALEMETSIIPNLVVQNLTIEKTATCWKLNWGSAAGSYTVQSSPSMAFGTWSNVSGMTMTTDPNTGLAEALIPCDASVSKQFFLVVYTAP
jgi:hypothetical protein